MAAIITVVEDGRRATDAEPAEADGSGRRPDPESQEVPGGPTAPGSPSCATDPILPSAISGVPADDDGLLAPCSPDAISKIGEGG